MVDLLTYLALGAVLVLFLTGAIQPAWVRKALDSHPSHDPEWQACLDAAWAEVEAIERQQGL